jgi:hypothetical protein
MTKVMKVTGVTEVIKMTKGNQDDVTKMIKVTKGDQGD